MYRKKMQKCILLIFIFLQICTASYKSFMKSSSRKTDITKIFQFKGWSLVKKFEFKDGSHHININALIDTNSEHNALFMDYYDTKIRDGFVVLSSVYADFLKKMIDLKLKEIDACLVLPNEMNKYICFNDLKNSFPIMEPAFICMLNALKYFINNIRSLPTDHKMVEKVLKELLKLIYLSKVTYNFNNKNGTINYDKLTDNIEKLKDSFQTKIRGLTSYINKHCLGKCSYTNTKSLVETYKNNKNNNRNILLYCFPKTKEEVQKVEEIFCHNFGFINAE